MEPLDIVMVTFTVVLWKEHLTPDYGLLFGWQEVCIRDTVRDMASISIKVRVRVRVRVRATGRISPQVVPGQDYGSG